MDKVKIMKIGELPVKDKAEHEGYAYTRRDFVRRDEGEQMMVTVYEIPPLMAAYPYHYHADIEEVFYIISGHGLLRTPDGEREVSAGELIYFPADPGGAHKLTNLSETEKLIYIDFDTTADPNIALYPDSGKVGVWGKGINKLFRMADEVGYYDGE